MVRHFSDKHPETTPPPVVSQSLVEAISSEMPEALTEKDVMIVVECATWRVRRLATLRCAAGSDSDYSCNHRFGWYPDSRHIWYQEDLPGLRRDYRRVAAYKQDVVSGRRRVLRGRDLDAVYNDWEMLNPRYRDGDFGMDGDRAFAYSPCQRVRVQVEPIDILERWAAGLQQVCVEWRDGCSQVVIERGRHKWHSILPLDVTRFPLRAGGTERVRGSVSLAKRGEPKRGGQM